MIITRYLQLKKIDEFFFVVNEMIILVLIDLIFLLILKLSDELVFKWLFFEYEYENIDENFNLLTIAVLMNYDILILLILLALMLFEFLKTSF
jgi:hypothetical protein